MKPHEESIAGRAQLAKACCALMLLACPRPESARSKERPQVVPSVKLSDEQRAAAVQGLPLAHSRDTSFYRGISLGLFASDENPQRRVEIYRILLGELKALGATDVQIVVRWAQRDVYAFSIGPEKGISASDEELLEVLSVARKLGLRTFLMPILHIQNRSRGQWRGSIKPENPVAWWEAYDAFILHHAKLAQLRRVALFAVGSELVTMESKEARWRALIRKVREVYKGRLTYSANWDHFEPVRIWDAVELIGVSAYQPLSKKRAPDEAVLFEGWRGFQQRVRQVAMRYNKPFVLTEVGYPSHARAAARPWDQRGKGAPDLALQLRLYRAMFRRWNAEPRLGGVFVWNWFGVGGPSDTGYTPRGKPAQEVLRRWFHR